VRFWEESGKLAKGVGVAFLALVAMRYTVVSWQLGDKEADRGRYETLSQTIEKQREGVYDVADAIAALGRSSVALDTEVKGLMKRVEIPFHPWTEIPSENSGEPGAYFRLQHAEQRDKLYAVCASQEKAVALSDPTLGFGDILGKPLNDKQAQENLNRLSIVVRVVKLLAKVGVREIVNISPDEPVETGPAGHAAIMREYPVRIRVKTRIDPLMRFLHGVRKPREEAGARGPEDRDGEVEPEELFLVVRGLDVRGWDPYGRTRKPAGISEDELMVSITAAGMRFFSEEERKAAPKPKEKDRQKLDPKKWGKAHGA
jgi:hypothetical protein